MKKLYVGSVSNSAWKKHSLTAVISCVAFAISIQSASAAINNVNKIYGSPNPLTAPTLVQPRNFTGLYVGASLDYGTITPSVNVACISPPLNFSFSSNCAEAIAGGAFPTHYTPSPQGMMGDAQAGYDFRFTNIVLGFVGDIAKGAINGTSSTATNVSTFVPEFASVEEKIDWLGTLRARVGFVINDFMPYITGGLAYGRVKTSYSLTLPSILSASQTSFGWQSGWTLGVGGEMNFGKFNVSLEYLNFNLGRSSVNPSPVVFGVPQPTTSFPTIFDSKGNLFRLGVNFPINV